MRGALALLSVVACRASVLPPPATTAAAPVTLGATEPSAEAPVPAVPEEIARSVDALAPKLRACGASVAASGDPSRVRVVFELVLGPRGEAVTVHATRSTLPVDVTFCMERVLRAGPYPRPPGPIRLSLPIRLDEP